MKVSDFFLIFLDVLGLRASDWHCLLYLHFSGSSASEGRIQVIFIVIVVLLKNTVTPTTTFSFSHYILAVIKTIEKRCCHDLDETKVEVSLDCWVTTQTCLQCYIVEPSRSETVTKK